MLDHQPMPGDASQQSWLAVFGVCVAVLVRLLLRKEWQHKREFTQQQ